MFGIQIQHMRTGYRYITTHTFCASALAYKYSACTDVQYFCLHKPHPHNTIMYKCGYQLQRAVPQRATHLQTSVHVWQLYPRVTTVYITDRQWFS